MRLDNFCVSIVGGREMSDGYVALMHGQTYKICLTNSDWQRRCDAEIFVDGKSVGNLRINRGASITLERPTHDNGKFTFYKADTYDAHKAGVDNIAQSDRGLVSVIFRPEKYVPPPSPPVGYTKTARAVGQMCGAGGSSVNSYEETCTDFDSGENESLSFASRGAVGQHQNCSRSSNYSAGMTGLSGKSNQSFYEVSNLDYDTSLERMVTVRLVHDGERSGPRELTPAETRSTPVPAPL